MMKFDNGMVEQMRVNASASTESLVRTAGRSLEMAEACSQLFFGGLRNALEQQSQVLKSALNGKDASSLGSLPFKVFQDSQVQLVDAQKLAFNLGSDYLSEMLAFFESRKNQIKQDVDLMMVSIKEQLPSDSDAVKQTLDAWIEFASKGFDQATEHGKKIASAPQLMVHLPLQRGKAKGNGASAA